MADLSSVSPRVDIPVADMPVIAQMQADIVSGFTRIQKAKAAGKPVILSSVLIPREILQSMDASVMYGNVLGAYASVFGLSGHYCRLAEDRGLSRDTCSVSRCAIGMACSPQRDPFFENAFVAPDLVLGGTFPCAAESKALLHAAAYYDIPAYILDVPIRNRDGNVPAHAISYYAGELERMIGFLETHGHVFNRDRLREELLLTKELNDVLRKIEDLKKTPPLALRSYDAVIAATAPLVMPREQLRVEVFEQLHEAIRERKESGTGVVAKETARLLWIGVPPMADFKLLDYPERHGAVVVKSLVELLTGFDSDPALLDPDRPLESIARAHLSNPISSGWVDYFVRCVREYHITGVISVVQRSCGMIPPLQRLTREAIQRETGIPMLIMDMDCIDGRDYDGKAARAQIDSFIETLLSRPGGSHAA